MEAEDARWVTKIAFGMSGRWGDPRTVAPLMQAKMEAENATGVMKIAPGIHSVQPLIFDVSTELVIYKSFVTFLHD